MKYYSFDEAKIIYGFVDKLEVKRQTADHALFKEMTVKLRAFEKLLGDEASGTYWAYLIKQLKRYRFDMTAAPLPFNHSASFSSDINEIIIKKKKEVENVYPSISEQFNALATITQQLANNSDNPILEAIRDLFQANKNYNDAILIKEPRLITPTENIINDSLSIRNINIINVNQLKGKKFYNRIIVIGPLYWYPKYFLRGPRTERVIVVNYNWVRDNFNAHPIFVSSSSANNDYEKENQMNENSSSSYFFNSYELLPQIKWSEIASKIETSDDTAHHPIDQELVNAYLFLLEDDFVVFFDQNAKVLVIELEEVESDEDEEETKVKRVLASEIQPGMFTLLRTAGGGEYIAPVADKILGKKAVQARKIQSIWKAKLKQYVKDKGFNSTIQELKKKGATRANEVNLRNWLSIRTIKPKSYIDYKAIMFLINLEDELDKYWGYSKAIEDAHRKAGFYIRRMLLKEVIESDLEGLEKNGKMIFELDEADGGSLTAFRVVDISPEEFEVPINRIGNPYKGG